MNIFLEEKVLKCCFFNSLHSIALIENVHGKKQEGLGALYTDSCPLPNLRASIMWPSAAGHPSSFLLLLVFPLQSPSIPCPRSPLPSAHSSVPKRAGACTRLLLKEQKDTYNCCAKWSFWNDLRPIGKYNMAGVPGKETKGEQHSKQNPLVWFISCQPPSFRQTETEKTGAKKKSFW